jgi:hypothetical protein
LQEVNDQGWLEEESYLTRLEDVRVKRQAEMERHQQTMALLDAEERDMRNEMDEARVMKAAVQALAAIHARKVKPSTPVGPSKKPTDDPRGTREESNKTPVTSQDGSGQNVLSSYDSVDQTQEGPGGGLNLADLTLGGSKEGHDLVEGKLGDPDNRRDSEKGKHENTIRASVSRKMISEEASASCSVTGRGGQRNSDSESELDSGLLESDGESVSVSSKMDQG